MRSLLAAATVLATAVGVHSAEASPILEVSVNANFSGDPTQTLTLLSQPLNGFDWNGFAIGLGPVSLPGGGLYVTVQGPAAGGDGPDTIFLRVTNAGSGAPAGGNGGTPPISNTFTLQFQNYVGSNAPPNTVLPIVTGPNHNNPPNWNDGQPGQPGGPQGDGPSPSPVPEPASLLLLGSGLASAALAARRRRARVS